MVGPLYVMSCKNISICIHIVLIGYDDLELKMFNCENRSYHYGIEYYSIILSTLVIQNNSHNYKKLNYLHNYVVRRFI